MAIATKRKPTGLHNKKRVAAHHRQTKHYVKSYWPYLPMLAIVASGFIASSLLHRPSTVLGAQSNLTAQTLLNDSNQQRVAAGDGNLSVNEQLNQAAQAKAQDMVAKNYWSHVTPSGQQPWSFLTSAGYQYQAAGENLAYGFDSADSVTTAWMNSKEHRANILDNDFTNVGFGVAQSPNFLGQGAETVVVALYARPVNASPALTPVSTSPTASTSVSRVDTVAASAGVGFAVGIIGALAIMFVLLRHGLAWHRLIKRGEQFVLKHPLFDTSLVGIATVAVVLSQTAGFIH